MVEILERRSQEVETCVASEITGAMTRDFGDEPSHVYVMFADVARSDRATGGHFFSQLPLSHA
jgi:phenylpyruvate tautomerase PptA (4-oxalocrotonate tautomerase family)